MRPWLIWILAIYFLLLSQPVLAVGEQDPLWQFNTYERKLNDVGQHLLRANGIQKRMVFHVRSGRNQVNAYANSAAGNVITVERGLLQYVHNDDELAFILGHEIAHIERNHMWRAGSRRFAANLALAMLMVGASSPGQRINPSATTETANTLTRRMNIPFELEADRFGIDYMVRGGYNPVYAESILTAISGDLPRLGRLVATHPSGTHRINEAHQYIASRYGQFLSSQPAPGPSSPAANHTGAQTPNTSAPPASDSSGEGIVGSSPEADSTETLLKALSETGSVNPPAPLQTNSTEAQATAERKTSPSLSNPSKAPSQSSASQAITPSTPVQGQGNRLVKALLSLSGPELALVKALNQRGYVEEVEYANQVTAELPEHQKEAMLTQLVSKNLIRVLGSAPERVFILSEWVTREMPAAMDGGAKAP